jgi:DNA topoisomerase-1
MVPDPRERVARKQVTEAVRVTADWLGNTPAVARSSYVHPAVLDAYLDRSFRGQGQATDEPAPVEATSTAAGLPEPAEEAAVLRILRRQRRATRSQGGR